jgi:hypothetical protein
MRHLRQVLLFFLCVAFLEASPIAVTTGGDPMSWGDNTYGSLGVGTKDLGIHILIIFKYRPVLSNGAPNNQ